MTKFIKYLCFPITLGFLLIIGCKKDVITTDTSIKLNFSTDTLFYDTLFTTLGSVTQTLKIYNPSNSDISISKIAVANGNNSNYAVNINGQNSKSIANTLLRAKDSLFIFVKVTIDPNNKSTPFIVRDSIEFVTNTNKQHVKLLAWGQNAYFHKAKVGASEIVIDTNTTFANDLPHIFMNNVVVKNGIQLTLNENTKLHFNNSKKLLFEPNTQLTINGLLNEEVEFSGINISADFTETPAQWNGIEFENENITCSINYAIIKNATAGLIFNNVDNNNNNTINITNTVIKNISGNALTTNNSNITGFNLLFYNAGGHLLKLKGMGNYQFNHCSFANYWELNNRLAPILSISDSLNFKANSSIFYSDKKDEELSLGTNNSFLFENCILQTELNINDTTQFVNCNVIEDAGFTAPIPPLFNYTLASGSPARYAADSSLVINFPTDLLGNKRFDTLPDIGAIEFIE